MTLLRSNFLQVLLLVALGGLTQSPEAWAARLNIAGAVNYPRYSSTIGDSTNGIATTGKTGYGGGASLEFGMGSRLAFELGGYYLQHVYSSEAKLLGVSVSTAKTTVTSVSIPVQLRFRLFRLLSFGLGAYYDYPLVTGTASDFGALFGARFDIPLSRWFALFLDGRYHYALRDSENHALVGLVGIAFGGGGKK